MVKTELHLGLLYFILGRTVSSCALNPTIRYRVRSSDTRQNKLSSGAIHGMIPTLQSVPMTFNVDEADMNALTTCAI
jgi:hypothetical protein